MSSFYRSQSRYRDRGRQKKNSLRRHAKTNAHNYNDRKRCTQNIQYDLLNAKHYKSIDKIATVICH